MDPSSHWPLDNNLSYGAVAATHTGDLLATVTRPDFSCDASSRWLFSHSVTNILNHWKLTPARGKRARSFYHRPTKACYSLPLSFMSHTILNDEQLCTKKFIEAKLPHSLCVLMPETPALWRPKKSKVNWPIRRQSTTQKNHTPTACFIIDSEGYSFSDSLSLQYGSS